MLNKKKVVPKLHQEVKVKADIVTSHDINIYYTGKFQDVNARYIIKKSYLFLFIVSSQTCPYAWSTKRFSETWPCYLFTNKIKRTWSDAQKFCEGMGGNLLVLQTPQERVKFAFYAAHNYILSQKRNFRET